MNKNVSSKKGWKPLPLLLKTTFVITLISLILNLPQIFSLSSLFSSGTFYFGVNFIGYFAIILFFLVFLARIIFLVALWNRYTWTWKYGIVYFCFFVLNDLFMIFNINNYIEWYTKILALSAEEYTSMLFLIGITSFIIGLIIHLIFLIITYSKRKYFN